MKKLLLASLIMATSLSLVACGKKEEIKVLTPSGTPLMAIGGLIREKGINIENVNGPENLVTGLSTKSHDIIIAPLTAGAKLSIAKKSEYKLEAVVTTNNTYIISKGATTLTNISDLSGKKLIAYGQNNTPDIALKNALSKSNITDCEITYEADVTTATSTFMGGSDYEYCLIAEPQITALKAKGAKLNVLDLKDYMSTTIYQAGIFVNPNSNQKRCNEVIKQIKNNIEYLNEKPAEYAKKVIDKNAFFTKMGEEVLKDSIPNANISFIKAKDNKDKINAYFDIVNEYNSKILGGNVLDEFYR